MCAYCNMGDHTFRYDPPFETDPYRYPSIPRPRTPLVTPWDLERLRDYHDLLKRVKELEEKLGCPSEPNKADYIGILEERIKALEEQQRQRD